MQTIKDPVLEPYHIARDNHGWTVYETVTPQAANLEEGSEGKDYVKPICHPASFMNCLKAVAKHQHYNSQPEFNSLEEYITSYTKVFDKIEQTFKKIDL